MPGAGAVVDEDTNRGRQALGLALDSGVVGRRGGVEKRQLLSEVWGPGYETAQGNLRLYMAQLRRKLEPDPSRPTYFRTEPGMGYRFEP